MGYAPDPLLRALVAYRGQVVPRRNPPTIAYVTNWATRWGWKSATAHAEFYSGAEAKAKEIGFHLDHFWMREPGLTQGRLSRILHARGISGVIIASHGRENGDAVQFEWDQFCAVKIDYFPHQPALHNVTNDQCDIVRLAVQKVLALGYRRIGFAMHRGWDHAVDRQWTAGFLCAQESISPKERIPMYCFPDAEPVERWLKEQPSPEVEPAPFKKWLDRHKPEVLISKSSFVQPALKHLGIESPRDLAFVDVFLEDSKGVTAGVRQNHTRVGAVAVEILSSQQQQNRRGIPEIPTKTLVEGTWFDGASCPSLNPLSAPAGALEPSAV